MHHNPLRNPQVCKLKMLLYYFVTFYIYTIQSQNTCSKLLKIWHILEHCSFSYYILFLGLDLHTVIQMKRMMSRCLSSFYMDFIICTLNALMFEMHVWNFYFIHLHFENIHMCMLAYMIQFWRTYYSHLYPYAKSNMRNDNYNYFQNKSNMVYGNGKGNKGDGNHKGTMDLVSIHVVNEWNDNHNITPSDHEYLNCIFWLFRINHKICESMS